MVEQNVIELEIKEALEIDEADILAELRRHSSKYFYYGVLWARASKQKRRFRLKTRELESRLTNSLRSGTEARITAEMKSEYLNSHPEFLEAEQELIQAEYMEEVLDVARDAMKQRGIALNELARQNRAEEMYGNEFSAMKREYKEQIDEIPKKRNRRTKAELMAAKQQEVTVYEQGNREVV